MLDTVIMSTSIVWNILEHQEPLFVLIRCIIFEFSDTAYKVAQEKTILGWEKILPAYTHRSLLQNAELGRGCILCDAEAYIRCKECGTNQYYCEFCYDMTHQRLLHVADVWKVSECLLYFIFLFFYTEYITKTLYSSYTAMEIVLTQNNHVMFCHIFNAISVYTGNLYRLLCNVLSTSL